LNAKAMINIKDMNKTHIN